jgi:adenylate cyclase
MSVQDEWEAAGLYDPNAPDAKDRLALLEWVASQEVGLDEMVHACAIGQLTSLVGDRSLRPGPRLTIVEMAARTGMTLSETVDLRRASGMPACGVDDLVYTEDDLPMFELFSMAAQVFSHDELVHFTRVLGASLRRIAEAASEMFLRDVEAPLHERPTAAPVDLAKANLRGIQLARAASGVFEPMFRGHLEVATQTIRRARVGLDSYSTLPLAIGFVDLHGFTSRSGSLAPGELLELVMTFESASADLVGRHGGRVVKLIGDEVMFSTVEPAEACAVAAALVEQAADWANGARAGIAHGKVITSGGDLYGEIVNLASRIADIAVPGEVLVNEAVTLRATELRFSPAGRRQLKGFAEPVRLWSLDE